MDTLNNMDEAQGQAARDQELFDRIAEHYAVKDRYASSRVARKLRLLQTVRMADSPSDSCVLEVGCGAGYAATYLQGRYTEFTGIDYSRELIQFARNHHPRSNVRFEAVDLFDFHGREGGYDLVFMIGVLHHMPNMEEALSCCLGLLKPGGCLIINEPQPANPLISFARFLRTRLDRAYSDEQEELRAEQVIRLFTEAGFTKIGMRPQGLFSTPFAEVVLKPQCILSPLSRLACGLDTWMERLVPRMLKRLTWNIIVYGERPL